VGTVRSASEAANIAPLGILTLDGKDLGRPILERLPTVAKFVKQRDEAVPIVVEPSGTYWQANTGYAWQTAAITINHDVSWQLQITQSGEYHLWGRVQTMDAQHDSFFVEAAKRLPDGSFMRRSLNVDWHLGVRENWTWVRLPVPIHLESGVWQLTLRPREYEGRIEQLFLTLDSSEQPLLALSEYLTEPGAAAPVLPLQAL